ncbi:hypothetical protein PHYBLDRAFT_59341 [Phycomyces blakesleeanus NRRL 1555(-)]|uniref:Uncharacterized protein n=1 Tax=Phycomyces blakesleeanus (strain ATCC 8743b / DSM 1359 / FGSC 10004 / NBRC 33097 / NRRL 1555) TaxID=763407 RepID=A0A167NG16_PHYB8|nr:hypothetical protein PHYBLDRAFT_59341 [Phycomyces blakesleeanus NRRL 1555(-)]OAD75809.1 hypothetical protein PHYBLDRAFT_59341 [Phycomyces blakesleeanus NRRL 1555(-)]|eukprot:XP_018293849.1 hypothetical protein PHYBLDRAFT_59341 [Phycomyces blakesleeanus NRRL 1555(-)]
MQLPNCDKRVSKHIRGWDVRIHKNGMKVWLSGIRDIPLRWPHLYCTFTSNIYTGARYWYRQLCLAFGSLNRSPWDCKTVLYSHVRLDNVHIVLHSREQVYTKIGLSWDDFQAQVTMD